VAAETPADRIRAAAACRGVRLSDVQIATLEQFLDILLQWRRRLALVSQTTAVEVVDKHIDDSLAVASMAPAEGRVVDLGSGAGFPGLVLAIACSGLRVRLVESQRRKASFLHEVVRAARLPNAEVVEARAEELPARGGWAGSAELVVSRAVWPTEEFFSLALPLLAPGGAAVAMKTPVQSPPVLTGYTSIEEVPYQLARGERRVLLLART
jgi:16S rRNA (guanine527-N7)-methyltransferase